jgi:mono/diheme cytochrome c family protein
MLRLVRQCSIPLLALTVILVATAPSLPSFIRRATAQSQSSRVSSPHLALHDERTSPSDLELGGDLAGMPRPSTRYITRDQLLSLPQVSHAVTNDANFTGPVQISGVSLEELIRDLAGRPASDLAVAICDDGYHAHYPQAYVNAHDPLLVLKVDGQPPSRWPKAAEGGHDMGPFLISQPTFTPSFKIFAHADEPQIPWGVVRIEFRDEKTVFTAIAPRGRDANDKLVQAGFRIAQQNCFRCHNLDKEGGTKAGHPWIVLAAWATGSPEYFAAYVRNPQSKNPQAQMPGNPGYDDQTIAALTAYFQTFSASPQSGEKP